MIRIKVWLFRLLLSACVFLAACALNSQPAPLTAGQSGVVAAAKAPQELAAQVLSEMGIADRYNQHFGNSVDIVLPPSANNSKLGDWLQKMIAREAGWKYAESKYTAALTANLSEAELKELLAIAQQPVMKKLMQTEAQAYIDSASVRRSRLQQVWDDYNSGKISVPPEVMR